jgi:hypothetical protein
MMIPNWFKILTLDLYPEFKKLTRKEFEKKLFDVFIVWEATQIKECKERISKLEEKQDYEDTRLMDQ